MGRSRQLWYVLYHVNALERGPSKRRHTVDVASVRPVLKERADGPEDEIPSRVCFVRHPLSWPWGWSGTSLEDLLVGCDPNRSSRKGDQETHPCMHATPSES